MESGNAENADSHLLEEHTPLLQSLEQQQNEQPKEAFLKKQQYKPSTYKKNTLITQRHILRTRNKPMKTKATVRFRIPSSKHLETIFEALEPETNTPPTERSQTILRRENKSLIFTFKTSDTVALRATMNAYLRWIKSIFDALKTLDNLL